MSNKRPYSFRGIIFDTCMIGYLLVVAWVLMAKMTEAQRLELGPNSLKAFGLLILAFVLSLIFAKKGLKTLGQLTYLPSYLKKEPATRRWFLTPWGIELNLIFWVSCYVGVVLTDISMVDLFDKGGLGGAYRIFNGLIHPEFSILPRAVLAIIETVFIAFMATVLSLPLSFVLSFLSAKNVMGKTKLGILIYSMLRAITNIIRSIEPLVWAIVFGVWVGIGPFAGMLALMLHSVASLVKQFSEIIESVEAGPVEAIEATGARPIQVVWFGIVPQTVLPFVSFAIYRWDINVRMATIIGLVGGGGIGDMLIQYQGQALWREVGCLVLVIAFVVWLMDAASASIREAIK